MAMSSDNSDLSQKKSSDNSETTTTEKKVMLVAIDDSEHSNYALTWTLDHFFSNDNPLFKLVLLHARPSTSAVGAAGPVYTGDSLDSELGKIAGTVADDAKQLCLSKSVKDVGVEVVEGDPRNVLCDTVEKYRASILVVGSHGYGTLKRAVLGSVSDYCAHHAHCTVMIVKKPKTQN